MSLVPFQNFPEGSPRATTRKPATKPRKRQVRQTRKPEDFRPDDAKQTRKHYTTHVSKTTGKPFYVTADGESTWEKPESEKDTPRMALPDGFEIRTSRSTGEQYFYDRTTGESMWDLPQPQKFVPGSIPHLLERAEDRVMHSFGILTCREIKYMLETSEMSEAEQVKFIEDNAKDTSILRKYIRACNLNIDQLKVISDTAPTITAQIQAAVYSLVRENTEPPIDDDPDVEPECAILRDKVNKFYKKGTGVTKRMWTAFIQKAKEVVDAMVAMTYDAFMNVYNSLPTKKQWLYVVQWFVSKGLSFVAWIHSNPKIAYYVMFSFKLVKEKGCQIIGQACKNLEWDPEQLKFIKYLKSAYAEALDPSQQESLGDKLLEFMQPLIQTAVIKGSAMMIEGICNVVIGHVKPGGATTTTLATLAVTSPVTAFVTAFSMAAVSLSVNEAAEKIKTKVQAYADELVYFNDIRNAYNQLMDLFNPLPCILEILKITGAAQEEKRNLHVYVWQQIASNPLYATTATVYRAPIPPIALRFKNLLLALDDTKKETYNNKLTIGEVRSLLDKFSRLQPDKEKEKEKTVAAQLLIGPPPERLLIGPPATGGAWIHDAASKVKTAAATKAHPILDAVNAVKDASSLYRSIVPRPRNDLVAVRDLANTKYYVVEDMWIQVGIYVWLLQQGLLPSNKSEYGKLSKLELKEYNEIESRCRADKYKLDKADTMTALNQWKVEFNDLRYTWDDRAFMETYEGAKPSPALVGILLMTLRQDVKDLFSKLGTAMAEKERPSCEAILDSDPYALLASAMDHLRNTSDTYYQEYPVWMNECFKSLKTGPYPQYYKRLLNSEIAPPYAKILKAYREYERILQNLKSGFTLKDEQNKNTAAAVNNTVGQMQRYLNAYYEFKTATTPQARQVCVQVKRAVEIPLALVASVIKSDEATAVHQTAGYTQFRKFQLLQLMQCILKRLDAPFMKNDAFHDMHGFMDKLKIFMDKLKTFVDKLKGSVNESAGFRKFNDNNFRQSIVNAWMMYKEVVIYGYSHTYAATQSTAYQTVFATAVKLRVDYENSFYELERLNDYIKSIGDISKTVNGLLHPDKYEELIKTLNEATERKNELETTQALRFTEANDAIQRVYAMETKLEVFMSSSLLSSLWGSTFSAKYVPTMLDFPYPESIKLGGAREEAAKKQIAEHASTALKEVNMISDQWKKSVKRTVEKFKDRMDRWVGNHWMGADAFTEHFRPKIRFTNCTVDPHYKKDMNIWDSWGAAFPFSGGAYDPFKDYVNVGELNLERENFRDEDDNARRNHIRENPYVLYVENTPDQRYQKVEQLFMDNLNPTVYQIFKDLGLPHPSIPFSKWESFLRKPAAQQLSITAQLEKENVDVSTLV